MPPTLPPYDLLLRNGHLIDPRNAIDSRMDVAIRDGKVAAVDAAIDPASAAKTLDLSGLHLTPGLIDLHTHLYHTTGVPEAWAGDYSVQPDAFSFRNGITTMVDAGSAGWRNFDIFYHTVIERARTRVLSFVNIAGLGMVTVVPEQDPTDFNPAKVAALARKYPDILVGVKTAHYRHPDWSSVDSACEAARLTGLPAMVDFGYFHPQRPYWELVGERLAPGDITTHIFRGPVPWTGADGILYDYLWKARARGVKFDVGHGGESFVLRNAVPAIAQGFWPDTISTDVHALSMNRALCDMPSLLSKFLALGMPLAAVIAAATWNAAETLHHPELGHLTPGAVADVAVWRTIEGDFGFGDTFGAGIRGSRRLLCELTLQAGAIVWNWNGMGLVDFRDLPADYGVRKGMDVIVPPR